MEIEEALKAGRLRAITATSSLELGIDMGAVDLVLQVASPGAVSRGLQRVGRAGHQVGGTSRAKLFPKHRGDLLEATVVTRGMLDGEVEAIRVPDSALDVLAQQIVAMVAADPWPVAELERVIRRAASYRELSRQALTGVLDMLAGRYPSDEFAELRPRLTWDRQNDVLIGRKGARLLSVVSGGTIPDRGLYGVHLGASGPKVGELDEEMVAESRKGETFILGATTWRIEDITRDRVVVSPAPGEPGKMPFWRADGPGRPVELGRALGAFCRELDSRLASDRDGALAWLQTDYKLDPHAATNLAQYLQDQRDQTHAMPTDRAITIERFRDELGDIRVCILSPFGGRIHAPWSLVLAHQLEAALGYPIHPLWTDDGIALRFADGDLLPTDEQLLPDPDDIERILVDELARSSVFASHFRENAARALLLPRRRPGRRTPLWAQRLKAQQLMGVALRFPAFPITLETYREVLRDIFDLPSLLQVLRDVRSRAIRIEPAVTEQASPFARSLVFDYVAAFLYQGDAPLAERKAQALTLDRDLLRELIGGGELRDLLDEEVLDEVERELQQLVPERAARNLDEVHDLVRRLGDLDATEIAARSTPDVDVPKVLAELVDKRRLAPVRIAGVEKYIAAEDAARYRDGLGIALPQGLPAALLERAADPLISLIARYARTHAPFTADGPARRWGIAPAMIEPILALLEARTQLVRGELRPKSTQIDSCDPDVLRQLRRRTLAKLRAQVAPVDAQAYAAFLPRWHGLDQPRRGALALRDAIPRIEGVALPFTELEQRILPARVLDYQPRMLDELGAAGDLVWVGAGALGTKDGRVVLLRRDRARRCELEPQPIANHGPLHDAIIDHLRKNGASFVVALEGATKAPRTELVNALWDLVWAGHITNDTFAPLRSLAAPNARRANAHSTFGGRWSLVESLGAAPTPTNRLHALATGVLERWGIASRQGARADDVPGGFSAIGDVYRAMEDGGTVRRGYFVESLEGAQFAWPGAIDRLREQPRGSAPRVDVLAAVDPANAWGSALPWPQLADPDAKPARRVGGTVVLVDGALVLWIEPKAKRIATVQGVPPETVELALSVGLPPLAFKQRRRELTLEMIDGQPAQQSPWAKALLAAGARIDYRGLLIRGSQPVAPQPDKEEELPDDDEEDVNA
ncbi:MAG: helicase-related protein [Kofleriaceae bacterium]